MLTWFDNSTLSIADVETQPVTVTSLQTCEDVPKLLFEVRHTW